MQEEKFDFLLRQTKEFSVYISPQSRIGKNVTIYPGNYIDGDCEIGDNVVLLPNNYINNSVINEGARISYSVVEDSIVEVGATVGPFAHLRPLSKIGKNSKVGNFVEIKNSNIGDQTKISHLSYVGDASVGDKVNIGCGVVFVNYNGKTKSKTIVGDGSFIGSSVNLIAPVKVGDGAFICAGTTVDRDVQEGDFIIGRSKMSVKPGRAKKYLKGDN